MIRSGNATHTGHGHGHGTFTPQRRANRNTNYTQPRLNFQDIDVCTHQMNSIMGLFSAAGTCVSFTSLNLSKITELRRCRERSSWDKLICVNVRLQPHTDTYLYIYTYFISESIMIVIFKKLDFTILHYSILYYTIL